MIKLFLLSLTFVSTLVSAQNIEIRGDKNTKVFRVIKAEERHHPRYVNDRWHVLLTDAGEALVMTCAFDDLNVVPVDHIRLSRAILDRSADYRFTMSGTCSVLAEIVAANLDAVTRDNPILISVSETLGIVEKVSVGPGMTRKNF